MIDLTAAVFGRLTVIAFEKLDRDGPKRKDFSYYGGRGIRVCDRWLHSFENFLADMGSRPRGKTIDRWPDPAGNYEPSNCRWATAIEQRHNRRKA